MVLSQPKSTYCLGNAICLGMNVPKCEYCGAEIELPFQCNYCGKHFCEKHRLIENHDCPDAPARTPLGSYQTKVSLANFAKKGAMKFIKYQTCPLPTTTNTVTVSASLQKFIWMRSITTN
jgi:hypothetical protein